MPLVNPVTPAEIGGLAAVNNLSDVASASTSLANLGGAPLANVCARAPRMIVPLPAADHAASAAVIFWSSVPVKLSSAHTFSDVFDTGPVNVAPARAAAPREASVGGGLTRGIRSPARHSGVAVSRRPDPVHGA